ncbi:MAG: hypothetical protein PF693_08655 [Spirochaetia bacterium]|jgi:hypothetical protein|nr:hypothetical protein [Spirochaetia bacterium]
MDTSGFQLIESMLSSHTTEAEAAVLAFSRHFASYSLNSDTATVFQKIIKYNNPAAMDAIIKNRNPGSIFTTLTPSRSLILFAITTLTEYRFKELYEPGILACLGVLQNIYKNPGYGMNIYPLSVADLYHVAKYLKVENEEIELLIISFLENLNMLSGNDNFSTISRNILDAHYDNSKKVENVIPSSILS